MGKRRQSTITNLRTKVRALTCTLFGGRQRHARVMFTMLLMSALKSKSKHKILRLRRHSPSPHCGVRDRLHFKAEGVVYVVKKVKVWKEESRGLPVSRWRPPRVRSNLKIDAAELRRAALSNGCEVCAKSKDQPVPPRTEQKPSEASVLWVP